ncbi:MAG: bifunctional folylpolyglutamate synthase/dihydrofolate synthase, partial [Chloroflexi bacterium]|nr:bifunctional folylpolyglutamate synthase/dihydrofolate synthase [Chloroflexota bacterium]
MIPIEPKYQEALDYLYSFVDYSLTRDLHYSPEKFNLDRMRALMEALGNPQNTFPVIHVAGTKGKGSTAAMIASMLMAADYRTGFYISPHLDDFAERIQVNRQPIPHAALVKLVDEIKPVVEKIGKLTTFEITTALAFEAFRRQHVDVAVVEVGLGGRLDSTNIVTPELSVITSLSMDHMKVLGDTLEQIAAEKAGIIKPGKPVISSPQLPDALGVIAAKAMEAGSELTVVNRDVETRISKYSINGQWFIIKTPESRSDETDMNKRLFPPEFDKGVDFYIPLLGRHQVDNAATAITAVMKLRQLGYEISDKAMQDGLAKVVWPCRFEVISRNPLIVVDSAHNRDSAHKLRLAVQDYFPEKPITLIFGASED